MVVLLRKATATSSPIFRFFPARLLITAHHVRLVQTTTTSSQTHLHPILAHQTPPLPPHLPELQHDKPLPIPILYLGARQDPHGHPIPSEIRRPLVTATREEESGEQGDQAWVDQLCRGCREVERDDFGYEDDDAVIG